MAAGAPLAVDSFPAIAQAAGFAEKSPRGLQFLNGEAQSEAGTTKVVAAEEARGIAMTHGTSAGKAVAVEAQTVTLAELPLELLAHVLRLLPPVDLARVSACCSFFRHGPPPQPPPQSPVEAALRLRATERGEPVGGPLPACEISWTQHLLARELFAEGALSCAGGKFHSAFVDLEGRLLTCGDDHAGLPPEDPARPSGVLGQGAGQDQLWSPTIVHSLLDVRVHSVSANATHT